MKTLLAAALFLSLTATSFAQGAVPCTQPCTLTPPPVEAPQPAPQPAPQVAYAEPAPAIVTTPVAPPAAVVVEEDSGWAPPVGRRFMHGFRIGWTYVYNWEKKNRDGNMSLKDEFDLKTPNMMLLGYEGFYRIVGHSWLNVLMVGNVTIAGLEQSKFIPAASGLLGFEFNRNFQLGVGVNVTPDKQAPSHMIAAAGWTPLVGSIQMPLHFFVVPDPDGNHRLGATVGMTW